ncbi:ribonucleoside-triphosphate reductase, adenosylcobalamin-dependent [Telmatospirillum sp. J64-1]|uniref:ribonucleoside-triphosphate reductase, adenosylcobalamin-dependent n=1 Tax=Telmatospirillum sp. J64-1 TaxID=2502183 RepID=UPI00115D5141|nr:ribonucleoside-triphosphate reductase, adenosylcobalamin-dependent [Telmatospirillum sp. J64-1]
MTPSTRAQIITRRTYNRPLDVSGLSFESWDQTIDRVIGHQRWLWERAQGRPLGSAQQAELVELRQLMIERKALPSGRTLWLGGTEVAKRRESSQFNCASLHIETVHDVVDAFWLLLQGCGVGFEPVVGTLNGFTKPVEIEVRRSTRTDRGLENNHEEVFVNAFGEREWLLSIGDSAEAWAKAAGKLLAQKTPVDRLVLDFQQIRPAGERLKGYGWISSGDETLCKAFTAIAEILNRKAGQLLDRLDILDIVNWLGTTLSSRRSAEIAVVPYGDPQWKAFALAKRNHWIDNPQRAQSNNSLLFYAKPSRRELRRIFQIMVEGGGSEPGFINAQAALRRAPWFKGVNPCAEIMLGNKSFCNLVEVDLGKFNGDWEGLLRAYWLIARANYRQTCVSFLDGILQRSWHELNEFLRLCGVGATGIVRWEHQKEGWAWASLRNQAREGAFSMADELGLPRPKAVTTVKPSGTLSKIMDTTEGVHKPLGKYILNNVRFSKHDPLVALLEQAGYRVFPDPYAPDAMLVTFPVSYEDVDFEVVGDVEVNRESALEQLERYKLLMSHYVDHNCSITVSYSPDEIEEIIDWLMLNWDSYVGVSWLFRNDPTKTAADLGYPYLPQEVVTKEAFDAYAAQLLPFNLDQASSLDELMEDGCATGACPIR